MCRRQLQEKEEGRGRARRPLRWGGTRMPSYLGLGLPVAPSVTSPRPSKLLGSNPRPSPQVLWCCEWKIRAGVNAPQEQQLPAPLPQPEGAGGRAAGIQGGTRSGCHLPHPRENSRASAQERVCGGSREGGGAETYLGRWFPFPSAWPGESSLCQRDLLLGRGGGPASQVCPQL